MEKRINSKVDQYITNIKDDICNKINNLNIEDTSIKSELLEFIYDYSRLSLNKEDFIKRKRIKNTIPETNRCNAKRANGEQCTRRRKDNCEFCGTHTKGTPHGLIQNENSMQDKKEKVEIYATEIMGIVYYIDHIKNVYNTEDIMNNIENPRVIAQYKKIIIQLLYLNLVLFKLIYLSF